MMMMMMMMTTTMTTGVVFIIVVIVIIIIVIIIIIIIIVGSQNALSQMSPGRVHFILKLKTTGVKTQDINKHKFVKQNHVSGELYNYLHSHWGG